MVEILLAGESWQTVSLHVKSRDVTPAGSYTEAADHLIDALEAIGATVTYQPCHVAHRAFPRSRDDLDAYDLVLLSDIGAETLLVTPQVAAGETDTNRCSLLAEYVADGGALGMIGGYMSFAGEGGKAGYARTAIHDVLPVTVARHDDRVETPEGATPTNEGLPELPGTWPHVLGYNRVEADPDASVWATVREDPLVVVGDHGDGAAFALTTDCAPHWAPDEFLEWDGLTTLWRAIVDRVVDGVAPE